MEKKTKILIGILGQLVSFWALNYSIYNNYDFHAIASSLIYMLCFGFGIGSSMYAYIPEILPSAGVGLTMAVKWAFVSIAGKLIPISIHRLGINWTLNIFVSKILIFKIKLLEYLLSSL